MKLLIVVTEEGYDEKTEGGVITRTPVTKTIARTEIEIANDKHYVSILAENSRVPIFKMDGRSVRFITKLP